MNKPLLAMLALAVSLCMQSAVVAARDKDKACSKSTRAMLQSCTAETKEEYAQKSATCINLADEDARDECLDGIREERGENRDFCKEQADARKKLCSKLGEAPYDQTEMWVQDNFVDPDDIGASVAPNPYFDLTVGNSNEFYGGGEVITVEVTDKIKLIGGVRCRTVTDVVQEDGLNVEVTDDWYAQDLNGNVWYCGEISLNYEFFDGDDPEEAEVVDIDGSWKAFREGAQPGIQFHAAPEVGSTYRQEMAFGEAEDVAEILTLSAGGLLEGDECESAAETQAVSDHAQELCAGGDCLVTLEYTPIEPEISAHKYYAPGVGFFLEVEQGACVATRGIIDEEALDSDDPDADEDV